MIGIKEQNFGLEFEFTGITRKEAADIIAQYFNSYADHQGGCYDKYEIEDNQNRYWTVVYDSSIIAQYGDDRSNPISHYKCELVTPICQYEDIKDIQGVLRALRCGGAKTGATCGIHIHIDGANHDARSIKNLVNIIASKEDVLEKAFNINPNRRVYCEKTDINFLEKINIIRNPNLSEIQDAWYNDRPTRSSNHYDSSRYRILNLHSYFGRNKTIEFRCFNSVNHAGKVKSYIQFCLAASAQAINQRSARYLPMDRTNDKYTFRTWLLRMQLIGDEYKTCRLHLLSNLEGTPDYKDREAAMERRRQMAQELAVRVEEARQESENPESFTIEQLPREVTNESGNQAMSLREQLDTFLESIDADETITLAERNQILSILNRAPANANQQPVVIQEQRRSRR